MIRISNVKLPLDYDDEYIKNISAKELKVSPSAIESVSLFRRSIDARHKNDIRFVSSLDVRLNQNENSVLNKAKNSNAVLAKKFSYSISAKKLSTRPIVIGAGPAGLFAGYILAKYGASPIIIERGDMVEKRLEKISSFHSGNELDTESNVQFGEGGAGTFSDGKLNTGTKDFRQRLVLETFAQFGAPNEILYNAKPHIGTDKLRDTVKNMRNETIKLGGEFLFNTKLVDILEKSDKNGKKVVGVTVIKDGVKSDIYSENVILSIGHSARDTFEMLNSKGIIMQSKAFSIGARIEHKREDIDRAQYGDFSTHKALKSADYKLNVHLDNGRGVYTFCMCPGGVVVPSQSEKNTIVTNGMSEFKRDKENSNSALLVSVTPDDFGSSDVLSGMYFQRKIEQSAFRLTNESYKAPVQRVGDFLKNIKSDRFGNVLPSYAIGTSFAKLDDCLPEFICDSMREAIPKLSKKLKGFDSYDALLTFPETRSSSPVRIIRNDYLESVSISGLYPCGEGAGYAGGIVSAAVDGIKCAERILTK